MNIAQSVREYLLSHGIKQAYISEKCGWSKQKTSCIIRGQRKMGADELASISDAVGVPYEFFYEMAARNSEPKSS